MNKFFLNVIEEGVLSDQMLSSVRGGASTMSCTCNGAGSVFTCEADDCKCDAGATYNKKPPTTTPVEKPTEPGN